MDWRLKLRDARMRARMSQARLAEAVGLSQSMISRIELGRRKASIEQLRKLANALGIKASSLIDEQ